MTQISVQLETTVNTGSYENVKIQYGIVDEPRAGENTPAAFDRIRKFVEDRLMESAAEVSDDWAKLRAKRNAK